MALPGSSPCDSNYCNRFQCNCNRFQFVSAANGTISAVNGNLSQLFLDNMPQLYMARTIGLV